MSLAIKDSHYDANVKDEIIPKVLVVEDDPSLREALQDTLTLAKYDSIGAPNVEAALEILADSVRVFHVARHGENY